MLQISKMFRFFNVFVDFVSWISLTPNLNLKCPAIQKCWVSTDKYVTIFKIFLISPLKAAIYLYCMYVCYILTYVYTQGTYLVPLESREFFWFPSVELNHYVDTGKFIPSTLEKQLMLLSAKSFIWPQFSLF